MTRSRWIPCLIYLGALSALSLLLNFHRLGERDLYGDEAIYACVAANMQETGDWLHPHLFDPKVPYLEKPPFYLWLSAAAGKVFTDVEFACRFWSALFGVGCVLLTFRLGASLFSPEAGFVAGLLLALNAPFVFTHGARHGTMDTGVVLCCLAAASLVLRAPSSRRPGLCWAAAGAAAGAACMLKGMPFGLLLLCLLGVYTFLFQAGGVVARMKGPLIAFAASLPVFLPWFIFQWLHYGAYIEHQHVQRLLGRMDPEHVQGPLYYLQEISRSSSPFLLFVPAVALAAVLSLRGGRKPAFGLLFILSAGWIGAASVSASKLVWYVYPSLPFVALAIAGVTILPIQAGLRRFASPGTALWGSAMVGLVTAALAAPCGAALIRERIPLEIGYYRDLRWDLYRSMQASCRAEGSVLLLENPDLPPDPFLNFYVDHHMRDVVRAGDVKGLLAAVPPGPAILAVDKRLPEADTLALDKRLADRDGGRHENAFYVAYSLGFSASLPSDLLCRSRPLDSYYLPIDKELSFFTPEAEPLLGEGWSDGETANGYRWSVGRRSILRLNLRRVSPLRMEMRFCSFGPQAFSIELNGLPVREFRSTGENEQVTVPLPSEHLREENELLFRFPDASSPAERGESADARLLGIAVRSMRFSEDKLQALGNR